MAEAKLTVDGLKGNVGPELAGKLDALGFDWTKFLSNLPALLQLLAAMFGKTV